MALQRTVMINFTGSVSGLMGATRAATADIGKLAFSVLNIGKMFTSVIFQGNFKPLISGIMDVVGKLLKVLFIIPGFLLAIVNPANVVSMAMTNFNEAISASSPAAFVAATRNMAPAMKEAVMAVRLLNPLLKNLRGTIQQGFWLGFATDINDLARVYFPILNEGLGKIASVIGNLRHHLVEFFLRPEISSAIKAWMNAFAGLGTPILALVDKALPLMIQLFTLFADILTNWVVPKLTLLAGWLSQIVSFISPILGGLGAITGGGAAGGATGGGGGGIGGFFGGIISTVGHFFSGLFGRAEGGSVLGGQSYVVGERGPEILSVGGAGTVTPNSGPGATYVTVKIGETELRDIVASEVRQADTDVALGARMGRGSLV
jgi:hypothetical protein